MFMGGCASFDQEALLRSKLETASNQIELLQAERLELMAQHFHDQEACKKLHFTSAQSNLLLKVEEVYPNDFEIP
jgi:hypothetical protein